MSYINFSKRVWQDARYFIAFGFGSGLMPFAPGTWGTLAAIPVFLLMAGLSPLLYLSITMVFFVLGVWVSETVTRDSGIQDYKGIVWDEVVGYLLTMFLAPLCWLSVLSGFLLFRLFDIWKPFPIRWVEKKVSGGLGVMLDDVIAAVPAWLAMQLVLWSFS